MSTLEGWASPTELKGADHTFVYCPDNDQYFGCWASGNNIHGKDAVQIVSATKPNAYAIANCYRDPVLGLPDTAGIGVYGLNGVCHQSANCFLFSADTMLQTNAAGRPGGLWASIGAYGVLGTAYAAWSVYNYWWCSGNRDITTAAAGNPNSKKCLTP